MEKKKALHIFTHQYPAWLLKNPGWIRLSYAFTYLLQLRKWYIQKNLKKLFTTYNTPFSLLDAGCGEGQYLFPFAETNPASLFKGIDKLESNITFCKKYVSAKKLVNVSLEQTEIDQLSEQNVFDIILCISVLVYCTDLKAALNAMNNALKPGGKFFLYVPVRDKSILPFYKKLNSRFLNYETIQNNQGKTSEEKLLELLQESNFRFLNKQYTYGFFGILSNELSNIHFILLGAAPFPLKIIIGLSLLIFMPIILVCMLIDYILPLQKGNGLVILAEKR